MKTLTLSLLALMMISLIILFTALASPDQSFDVFGLGISSFALKTVSGTAIFIIPVILLTAYWSGFYDKSTNAPAKDPRLLEKADPLLQRAKSMAIKALVTPPLIFVLGYFCSLMMSGQNSQMSLLGLDVISAITNLCVGLLLLMYLASWYFLIRSIGFIRQGIKPYKLHTLVAGLMQLAILACAIIIFLILAAASIV